MRIKYCAAIIFFMLFLEAHVFAFSLEITTGSGRLEGVKDSSGQWLKDGSLVQVIRTKDGIIYEISSREAATPFEEVVATTEVGNNFPFNRNMGKFDTQVWLNASDKIYVRAWNGRDSKTATECGESGVFSPKGFDGEVWNINGKTDVPAIVLRKKGKR